MIRLFCIPVVILLGKTVSVGEMTVSTLGRLPLDSQTRHCIMEGEINTISCLDFRSRGLVVDDTLKIEDSKDLICVDFLSWRLPPDAQYSYIVDRCSGKRTQH